MVSCSPPGGAVRADPSIGDEDAAELVEQMIYESSLSFLLSKTRLKIVTFPLCLLHQTISLLRICCFGSFHKVKFRCNSIKLCGHV